MIPVNNTQKKIYRFFCEDVRATSDCYGVSKTQESKTISNPFNQRNHFSSHFLEIEIQI